jgi:hypothetical protein
MATPINFEELNIQQKQIETFSKKHDELSEYRHWLWTGSGYGPERSLDLPTLLAAYFRGEDDIPGIAGQALDAVYVLDNLLPIGGINPRLTQLAMKVSGYVEPLDPRQMKERTEAAINLLGHLHSMTMMLMEASFLCAKFHEAGQPGSGGVCLCKLRSCIGLANDMEQWSA